MMHGGKAPQTIAAARQRLLEAVEPGIVRLLRFIESPPGLCDVCGRSDDTSAIVSAIRTVFDRAGLGPTSTIKVGHESSAPEPWIRWMTNDEYETLLSLMLNAIERKDTGSPAFAEGGIRRYVEIPMTKTVCLPQNTREPQPGELPADFEDGSYVELDTDEEGA